MLVALLTSTLLGSQAWACTVGLVTPAGRELVSDNPVFSWDTDCVVSRIGFSRPGASTWQWRSWGTVSSLTHPDPAWDRLSEGPWVHGVRWKVQGRDADGGMAASSTHFLNVNVPPESPSIEVVPSDPVAGAHDLVCEIARSSTDADGDAVSYHFHWVVDGGSYPRSSDTGPDTTTWTDDTIPTEDLSLGESLF